MKIFYDAKIDLLYMRLDEEEHEVINKRVTEDIVLDIEKDKIIGIEILDASKHINLAKVLPIKYSLNGQELVSEFSSGDSLLNSVSVRGRVK